jgi:hypothetical protein
MVANELKMSDKRTVSCFRMSLGLMFVCRKEKSIDIKLTASGDNLHRL